MNCIDWNARDLPITVDGWLVYAFNKIIDCKCTWGDMYKLMREDLIAILVSSVLYCINELPALSNRAKMRWALNLTILEETLYMNKLKPIIDPNDPAQQRTIDPQFGALGKKPELCYVAIEQALELTSNELKSIKTMTEYNLAKKQLDMQILSLK